nr:hypothetical protein [Phascolarctobacterium succinatutens]
MGRYVLATMVAFFTIGIINVYSKNLDFKLMNDKKYFVSLNFGALMIVIFMIGCILDIFDISDFIRYCFPLWGLGLSLMLYGIKRRAMMKMFMGKAEEEDYKVYNIIKEKIIYIYIATLLLLLLYVLGITNNILL